MLIQCFLIARHVSSDTPLIIRSSKTVIADSGFTYVFELLMMSGVSPETCWSIKKHWKINSTTRLHHVGSFYEIHITMDGSMNIMFKHNCIKHDIWDFRWHVDLETENGKRQTQNQLVSNFLQTLHDAVTANFFFNFFLKLSSESQIFSDALFLLSLRMYSEFKGWL